MSQLLVFVVGLLLVSSAELAATVMDEDELLALLEVMDSLLDEKGWSQAHPDPCFETPWPGIFCEISQGQDEDLPIFHVTGIHVGPDVSYPPCKSSPSLSVSLLKLPYLKSLSIFNCFLISPVTLSPMLLGSLTTLEHLSLDSNPSLSGEIPPSIGNLTALKVLTLSQNNLTGYLPSEIGELSSLQQLDLSHNRLSGEIPQKIGELERLTILDLSWNGLRGLLPSSMGELQFIQKIDLSFNRLEGRVPQDVGKLGKLVLLDLSHNLINGPIPEALSSSNQLEYLIFDQNSINSETPTFFLEGLKNLRLVSFSGCGLTGSLPKSLSSLKNLIAVSLDNNSLTGTIPPDVESLPRLDHLNLSYNKLSGELSFSEGFLHKLGRRLDVRGNSGLCTSNHINTSANLRFQIPQCTEENGHKNRSLPGQNSFGSEPSFLHGQLSSFSFLKHPNALLLKFVVISHLILQPFSS